MHLTIEQLTFDPSSSLLESSLAYHFDKFMSYDFSNEVFRKPSRDNYSDMDAIIPVISEINLFLNLFDFDAFILFKGDQFLHDFKEMRIALDKYLEMPSNTSYDLIKQHGRSFREHVLKFIPKHGTFLQSLYLTSNASRLDQTQSDLNQSKLKVLSLQKNIEDIDNTCRNELLLVKDHVAKISDMATTAAKEITEVKVNAEKDIAEITDSAMLHKYNHNHWKLFALYLVVSVVIMAVGWYVIGLIQLRISLIDEQLRSSLSSSASKELLNYKSSMFKTIIYSHMAILGFYVLVMGGLSKTLLITLNNAFRNAENAVSLKTFDKFRVECDDKELEMAVKIAVTERILGSTPTGFVKDSNSSSGLITELVKNFKK